MTEHPRSLQAAPMPIDRQPAWDARDLTHGGRTAAIVLDGQVYQLRITRDGKLILTK
jgi:hemin uptake protein HemP